MTTYSYERYRELQKQRTETLRKMRDLVDRAKAAGRDLDPGEQQAVTAGDAKVKELDDELRQQSKAMVDSVMSLGTCETVYDGSGGSAVFDEQAKTGIIHAIKSRTMYRFEVPRKAITTGAMLPTAGTGVEPGLHPNLFPIASLFRTEQAGGPTQRYYRFDGATADIVAEAAVKPDSGVTITPVDVTLDKIATLANFSDEMVEDAGYLVQFLQQELTKAVIVRENQAILDEFAGTSGVLTGTGAAADVVDLIADALAGQEALSGVTPSAVIAHPNVVATIRKAKADTSGVYTVDPLSAAPASIHGVRLVSTPATAAGTVWVAGGQGVVIYRRGAITAEIGYNGTDWSTNTRTMRAEERMATAVVRPSSLTKLTVT